MGKYIRSSLLHFSQGLLMGGSDIIPGVSGGTMALIVGIYTRLIDSISSFFSLLIAGAQFDREMTWRYYREVEWRLIIPLALGIVTAFGIGTQIIPYLLETYPQQCRGLFFGLVMASVVIPWRRIHSPGLKEGLAVVVFAVLAYYLTGLPPERIKSPSLWRVFLSTGVAICAMILPGVSGAFLLEALGVYKGLLEKLGNLNVGYLLAFAGGAAVGLGVFSKILNWLLKHRHDATMAALVGLMIGALRALWPWQTANRVLLMPGAGDLIGPVIGLAVLGFGFIVLITWLGSRRIEKRGASSSSASVEAERR